MNSLFKDEFIQGNLPNDLRGTFSRNGPGLLEVYGTKLVILNYLFIFLETPN